MPSISFLNHLGALLTLWLLLCCGAPAAENGRILMVTEATFPPYEFRNGNAIMGIDPEIMREVARRTGRELVIEDMSFDSVITAVVSGKADVAASGITVTPERRRKVDFSIPYVEAAQVIIVPKGSPIRRREDIRSQTYTAFMPLTAVALVYLSVVMLFSWMLGKLERKLKNNE